MVRPPVYPPPVRRRFRFDLTMVVLLLVSATIVYGMVQSARMLRDAHRGMIAFERAQRDVFIDAALIKSARGVSAGAALTARLKHETVMVVGRISERRSSVGSGVVLRANENGIIVLTARHVVRGRSDLVVVLPDTMRAFRVDRIVMAGRDDLALVYANAHDPRMHPVAFAHHDLTTRDRFVVVGHPGKYSWSASPGIAERHLRHIYLYCPGCDRGDSGGGVFAMDGTLTGIVTSKVLVDAPTLPAGKRLHAIAFFAVPLERTRAFVRRYAR